MTQIDGMAEILDRLATLVAENRLAELTVEDGGLRITIKGADEAAATAVSVPMHPHLMPASQVPFYSETAVTQAPRPVSTGTAPASNRIALESPMMGVFYRSPSPGDPPFVNVGDIIQVGQTVGLIEAMKVYSELPSEISGRIVEMLGEDGKLVKQGQPLLYVEPV